MSAARPRQKRDYAGCYSTPTPTMPPLIGQAEMVRRIEAVRASDGFDSRQTDPTATGPDDLLNHRQGTTR